MKLKVHYTTDGQGERKAAKININDWERLRNLLEAYDIFDNENIEIIETPVEIKKVETNEKARHFSDFIMDI